jgi:hypothetical protein
MRTSLLFPDRLINSAHHRLRDAQARVVHFTFSRSLESFVPHSQTNCRHKRRARFRIAISLGSILGRWPEENAQTAHPAAPFD